LIQKSEVGNQTSESGSSESVLVPDFWVPASGFRLPTPFDLARAERTHAALAEQGLKIDGRTRSLLSAAFGNSPFLSRLAIREAAFLCELMRVGAVCAMDRIEASMCRVDGASSMASAQVELRQAKRQAALAVALADIAGLWSLEQVTASLTRFADACVGRALRFLLRERAFADGLAAADPSDLESQTGLVVLAMGKYGADELNYSSDIDLIVFYDAARFPFRKKDDARGAAVDLVKGLVKLIGETTQDGYVFRTDLRLRPDAGATQVAISTEAAEHYYEGMGQNWERAAMIKARPCAGDLHAARIFLGNIEPFVWRRSLDYAAIEDIHSIKRQIHTHGGHGAIAAEGHNIKLGRGGIREIEFFVQTQQLILGGRNPELRHAGTLRALKALHARGFVSERTAAELSEAYRYLRRLEHRLQMIDDQQTHTLPKSHDGLAHVSCFMGYADTESFRRELIGKLETVQSHYARLFERAPPLGSAEGSLVFTGVEDDPDTIETLEGMGFKDPHHAASAIRGWHHGRVRATRSARAREILTKLMPALLDALAQSADPDAAFAQFDRFVSRLPAGVQLFSLLLANPEFLKLIATTAGSAPKLADYMTRFPAVLDALLDSGFLHALPRRKELDAILATQLSQAEDYESVLGVSRRFAREQIFRVGVQVVEGTAKAEVAGAAFANIAECAVASLLDKVEAALAVHAGHVRGSAFAVIAMGKLGGREMTAGSDLDLVFVYEVPMDAESSDGPKPLPSIVYFARLAQRLIAALTVQTSEGGLYEVDMRLRPTGNKGPVAVSLDSFERYYLGREAWTWERLALTRARMIAGPQALRDRLERIIRQALMSESDAAKLAGDVKEMRSKIAAQFPGKSRWDLKFAAGGLVDIEFVAQYLQLLNSKHAPHILDQNTLTVLERLRQTGILAMEEAEVLLAAAKLQHALTQVLRIALDGTLDPSTASAGLKALLARAAGAKDFAVLEQKLFSLQSRAHAVFERVISDSSSA
jgi:[glutamine synthetase] adenylyltransferase / [glutamine synthetase]-adenylyl-L-tyrosine phosphorylase